MIDLQKMGRYVEDDPAAATFRVSRKAFSSPDVFQTEMEQIFERVWLYIGHESEVPNPNDFVTRTILNRPLILCRDSDGKLHVFLNSCRHRGAELCRVESGNARLFQCFYHAWTFDTKGELVGVPDREGYPPSFREEDFKLAEIKMSVYRGFIFISFNRDVQDLEGYLGGAREYLDLVADHTESGMEVVSGSHRYPIAANWKLLVENSLDGYHLMPLHATYFDFLKSAGNVVEARRETHAYDLGNGHALITDRAPWGRPTARWKASLGEDTREEIEGRWRRLVERLGPERADRVGDTDRLLLIFPNLVINDILAVTIRSIWPVAPGKMDVTAWALAPKDDTPALRKATLKNFVSFLGPGGFATPDDIEALESVQRTMLATAEVPWSDMSRGMSRETGHPSLEEHQTRAFWRHWQRLMQSNTGSAT